MQILKLWWFDKELHGIIEVLNTPAGRLIRNLYCQGIVLGASTRASSSTTPHADYPKLNFVTSNLRLYT